MSQVKICPKCATEIPAAASICPQCRSKLSGGAGQGCAWIVVVLGSGIMLAMFTLNGIEQRRTPAEKAIAAANETRNHCVNDKFGAYYYAKSTITASLKAPSTAEFSSYNERAIETGPDCKYTIAIYVDAQNSFGAKIRTSYQLILKAVGSDEWQLLASRTI